jgi:transposase-like protein
MNCPKCKSTHHVKDGKVRGLQRYKCKTCSYRYSVSGKSNVKSVEIKRLALSMYLEGLGFRAIGRVLKISYGTVYAWVKAWEAKVTLPRREEAIRIVELDEMHTYGAQKKTAAGYGLLLTDLENGTSILSVATVPQQQE